MSYSRSTYRRRDPREPQPSLIGKLMRGLLLLVVIIIAVKVGLVLIGTLLALGFGAVMLVLTLAPFIIAFWLLWALFRLVFC